VCALRLLLLPLQLEIELLLALHCRKKAIKTEKSFEIARQEVRVLTRLQMNAIPVLGESANMLMMLEGKSTDQ
jgi:hypothetical protein